MITFTAAQIRKFAPLAKDAIVQELVDSIDEINAAGVDTPRRLHCFMANISPETAGLRALEENLNYSAAQLRKTFPTRVTTDALANQLARQPQKIANFIYGGRFGNNKSGDGWKYRGGGMLQTTFKANYESAGYADNPEALRTPGPALKSALHYWKSKNCNRYADQGDIVGLRKVINGGSNGLAEVRAAFKKAQECFPGYVETQRAPTPLSKKEIMRCQMLLEQAGYFPGAIDGKVGQQTLGEISKFQTANALKLTGEFDAATRDILENSPPRLVERAHDAPPDSTTTSNANKIIKGGLGTIVTIGAPEMLEQVEVYAGKFKALRAALEPLGAVKDFVLSHIGVPGVVIIVAGVVVFVAWRIKKARIRDYLSGKIA